MRRLLIVALVAVIGLLPITFSMQAHAQGEAASQTQLTAADQPHRLLAAGAGAILGIFFFNLVTTPFGAVPWAQAALVPAPKDLAVGSRIFATLAGGSGAIIAHYLYNTTH